MSVIISTLFTNRQGVNVGDHPPITPTRAPQPGELRTPAEERLYDHVLRHFLGTVSSDRN